MEFRAPDEHTIATRLTRSDLEKMHITFDTMDYADANTRQMIHALLERARQELHIPANPHGRTIIEAFGERDGGCRIVFKLPPEEGRLHLMVKRRSSPLLFAFGGIDPLLDACAALPVQPESDLYRYGQHYFLLLASGQEPGIHAVLSEYGTDLGEDPIRVQAVREHAQLLSAGNAIRRLAYPRAESRKA